MGKSAPSLLTQKLISRKWGQEVTKGSRGSPPTLQATPEFYFKVQNARLLTNYYSKSCLKPNL